MIGKIIKSHRGIYYVEIENTVVPCKARGLFREQKIKPIVGDNVEVRVAEEDGSGYIETVYTRKNALIRPPVANVDQVVLVMSLIDPEWNPFLLDQFLLMCEKSQVKTLICINKNDLIREEEQSRVIKIYENTGYDVFFTNIYSQEGISELSEKTKNRTTAFAGPSGVGKSSLLNILTKGKWNFQTGQISEKTKRGKHTTRHVELIHEGDNTFFLDTPGFSSLDLRFINDEDEVKKYMPDFYPYANYCKFQDCNHLKEPGCAVKTAVEDGDIDISRYESYQRMFQEVKSNRRY